MTGSGRREKGDELRCITTSFERSEFQAGGKTPGRGDRPGKGQRRERGKTLNQPR